MDTKHLKTNSRRVASKVKYVPPAVANFYQDSDEEILDRILAAVHGKLDEEFGSETNNDPQFSKTVFKSHTSTQAIIENATQRETHSQTALVGAHTEGFRGTAANIASLSFLSLSSMYFLFEMWRSCFY